MFLFINKYIYFFFFSASCSSLTGSFQNTQLITENLLHSGQVVFACNSGFSLATGQTSFSFTCNDGVWNYDTPGLLPACTASKFGLWLPLGISRVLFNHIKQLVVFVM